MEQGGSSQRISRSLRSHDIEADCEQAHEVVDHKVVERGHLLQAGDGVGPCGAMWAPMCGTAGSTHVGAAGGGAMWGHVGTHVGDPRAAPMWG